MISNFLRKINYSYFLLAVSVIAGLLLYIATATLGSGLGGDSAIYLSAAQNLSMGKGYVDYSGNPITHWPPAYSLLLAVIHQFTGFDVFDLGWILNVLIFSTIIWTSGTLMKGVFKDEQRIFASLGPLFLLLSTPLISIAANISTDPLFMLLVIFFLLSAREYLDTYPARALTALGMIAATAPLVRYAGFSLVFSGGLLCFYANRKNPLKGALLAATFIVLTSAPIVAWAFFHNYALAGSFFGNHGFLGSEILFGTRVWNAKPILNLILIVHKVFSWYVPARLLQIVPALALFSILVLTAILGVRRTSWKIWFNELQNPNVLPSALFASVYSGMLMFFSSYHELRFDGSDRVHVILLAPLLILGITSALNLLPAPRMTRVGTPRFWLLTLLSLALLISGYRTLKYLRVASQVGDTNYNFINTAELRESDLITYIQRSLSHKSPIYSNNEAIAWFYLRKTVLGLPDSQAANWPPIGEHGFIVGFGKPLDYKPNLIELDRLEELGWITQLFASETGTVYELTR